MVKRKRKKYSKSTSLAARPGGRLLIPGVLGLAILLGSVTWYLLPQRSPFTDAAQGGSGPRLVVDKELIDFGPVAFEKRITARFHLKNVGDQPLRLALDPQVEPIEGC